MFDFCVNGSLTKPPNLLLFQEYYNLTLIGKIDNKTIDFMRQNRSSVADEPTLERSVATYRSL